MSTPALGSRPTPAAARRIRDWWRRPGGLELQRLDSRSGRMTIQAWIASRGLIGVVALLLAVLTDRELLQMVNNWDAVHFSTIARSGYASDPEGKLIAFFPGLPTMLRIGLAVGIPTQITGLIVAAVGSAAAAAALIRLGGPWAAIIWLFLPTAVFTTVPYTESLFCALAFWAWERARSDRWLAAALLTGLACTVRVSGLFLIGALFIMIITSGRIGLRDRLLRTAMLLIPALVLGLYAFYLHGLTGSWTAWYDAQAAGWSRGLTMPWESLMNTIPAIVPGAYADQPYWAWVFRGEVLSMIVGLVTTGWCLYRKMWAEASWVAVQVLAFSLSYWFMSVNRAVLLWFPLVIMLAHFGNWRPRSGGARAVHQTVVVLGSGIGIAVMMVWAWLFFSGYWAS